MNSDNTGLLSFSIITYQKFDGIFATLDSLFLQDYPRIELIISDDASYNYCDEIVRIKEYIDKNKSKNIEKVVYSHLEQNVGTVGNVNNALKLANGEFIKVLGGGDILICNDALSRYVKFLKNNSCDIVFAKLVGITEDGRKIQHLASCEENYDMLRQMTPEQLCNRLYARNFLPAPAWCGTKKLIEQNGYFLTVARLIEDYPYWIHLCQNNVKIGFMDDVLIGYELNGISSTGTYGVAFMEDMYKIYEHCIFPFDKRFGILQPIYNKLKRLGLDSYMAKAKWNTYSQKDKAVAYMKYGIFFAYIKYGQYSMKRKNNN